MSTKDRPGRFDCLSKLAPDEPFFVLRGQDVLAADLVEQWAVQALALGCHIDKVNEARAVADEMRTWPNQKNPD